ncbi:Retrovirus-related Pol polyprotein from transposon RE2 [Vitis vinifera]|uniref:Retrovirus-related Pol polyprotein from transposon RE2 n=1 Tax=Vitis vinifera TaxID=29760 RepID=A0A438HQL3_VITVI|nr:Retrovirus-related Pol polyprotein from transposon RE2 [Vitis vinifera]
MSWLYASLSEDIMAQIVGYSTTVEIWNVLNQIYSTSSMAWVTELHTKLQTLKKDGLLVGEYIQRLKSICNSLAAIGELVSEKDQLIYLFNGLYCATHHFTLDINMLDTMTPFSGSEQVTVGNGKQLCISHLGTAKLPSSYSPLVLHQVERKNHHAVEMGLSFLARSGMPLSYWPYAFQTATYLINRLSTPVLHHQSPYFALYHKLPAYTHLKVFGSSCFPYLRPYNTYKLQYRSLECAFLGCSSHHKVPLFISLPPLSPSPPISPSISHSFLSSSSISSTCSPLVAPTSLPPSSHFVSPSIPPPSPPSPSVDLLVPCSLTKPTSFLQAIKDPSWKQAMEFEFAALQHNKTWHLVPSPSLGKVHHTPTGIHLSQAKYITDLLTRAAMLDAKPCPTSMSSNTYLSLHDGVALENGSDYRSFVGALYLPMTSTSLAIQMPTGLPALMTSVAPVATASFLPLIWFLGHLPNKKWSPAPAPNQSTEG